MYENESVSQTPLINTEKGKDKTLHGPLSLYQMDLNTVLKFRHKIKPKKKKDMPTKSNWKTLWLIY